MVPVLAAAHAYSTCLQHMPKDGKYEVLRARGGGQSGQSQAALAVAQLNCMLYWAIGRGTIFDDKESWSWMAKAYTPL